MYEKWQSYLDEHWTGGQFNGEDDEGNKVKVLWFSQHRANEVAEEINEEGIPCKVRYRGSNWEVYPCREERIIELLD